MDTQVSLGNYGQLVPKHGFVNLCLLQGLFVLDCAASLCEFGG